MTNEKLKKEIADLKSKNSKKKEEAKLKKELAQLKEESREKSKTEKTLKVIGKGFLGLGRASNKFFQDKNKNRK